MFFSVAGELYRTLLKLEDGVWAICYDAPSAPLYVANEQLAQYQRVAAPEPYLAVTQGEPALTAAQERKLALITPLLQDSRYIVDNAARRQAAQSIAEKNQTTARRVLRLFYLYLAQMRLGGEKPSRQQSRPAGKEDKYADFKWAIETFYFSAKRLSLRMSYDLMLAQRYMTTDGRLMADAPSWDSFRH